MTFFHFCDSKILLFAALALTTATTTAAQTPTAEPTYKTPKFAFLRYNEDWSELKDVDVKLRKPSERKKHVKLSKDGRNWVSLGGHLRARIEAYDDFAFGAPADANDSFILYRGLFHADWHFGENVRIFSELKHADVTSRSLPGGARPVDEDQTEIQQLFIDYKFDVSENSTFAIRVGRQGYGFGKNRLVSPLPWANALRHWDGITGILNTPRLDITFFVSSFNPVDQSGFNDNDSSNKLSGFYAERSLSAKSGLEYYWLATERDEIAFNGTAGDESRDTFGLRHWGRASNQLGYELEGAYQTGDLGSEDISAFMLSGEAVYTLPQTTNSTVSLTVDFASGDDDAGGEVNTFNQLFPLGHAYFGAIDTVARQNIIDISAAFSTKTSARSFFKVAVHNFSRADRADALYNAGGGVVRAGDITASKDIGNEIDLSFNYSFTPELSFAFGYSQLFAGDFLSDTGADEDIKFAFSQILYNF